MVFLGLVGAPVAKVSYETFKGLATGTGFGASTLRAGAQAAGFGITRAAGLLGLAGAGGFLIGQKILEGIEYTEAPLTIRQLYKVPGNQGRIRATFRFKLTTTPLITDVFEAESPLVAPVSIEASGGTYSVGYLSGANSAFSGIYQAAPAQVEIPLEIIGVTKVGGAPANFQKIPSPALPIIPYAPIRVPTTVPTVPGQPDFPITPTVIPLPERAPDREDTQREPGVLVQIPEAGIQLGFYPSGVSIGSYRSPETEPFEEPKIAPPPGNPPPANDECPCPEGENKDEEIICRIKTLQTELLDDGYNTTTHLQGASNYIEVSDLPDEFYRLEIGVTQKPSNVKTQFYADGDVRVEWVGWLSWMYGSRKGERIFLQFSSTGFRPPPECTGYAIAMNEFCLCNSLALTRKKKDYVDLCTT